MKKKIGSLMLLIMVVFMLSGCNNEIENGNDKINIVCTTFSAYDWTKQIVGNASTNVEVKLLYSNGTDMHSYQATAKDVACITESDIVIYVGGSSEEWIDDIVKNFSQEQKAVKLLDVIGNEILTEELVEGMQHEHEEGEEHYEHHEENEYDEHVWLSVENAILFSEVIKNELCFVDQGNSDIYEVNYRDYKEKLIDLQDRYKAVVENKSKDTILFADRFPFRYLVEELGIEYYAAFAGCSSETQASFETIVYLANKIDEENLDVVLVIENSTVNIAQTVISNTKNKNQKVMVLDSMQSVTQEALTNGSSYISVMEDNLLVLEEALK